MCDQLFTDFFCLLLFKRDEAHLLFRDVLRPSQESYLNNLTIMNGKNLKVAKINLFHNHKKIFWDVVHYYSGRGWVEPVHVGLERCSS